MMMRVIHLDNVATRVTVRPEADSFRGGGAVFHVSESGICNALARQPANPLTNFDVAYPEHWSDFCLATTAPTSHRIPSR